MFTCNPSFERALLPIAQLLFSELKSFGILASPSKIDSERLKDYIVKRGSFIKSLLQLLEEYTDLRFTAHQPYCYQTQNWPANLPLAGLTTGDKLPRPSDVVTAMVANWSVKFEGGYTSRALRVALWITHQTNLSNAIQFIFRLEKSGFMLGLGLDEALLVLLAGRSQVESEEELVRRCLRGSIPTSPEAWMPIELDIDWVDVQIAPKPAEQRLLAELLNIALDEVESLRNAASWDEWIVGQIHLSVILPIISNAYIRRVPEPSLAANAILSQLEEIVADAFALTHARGSSISSRPFAQNFSSLRGLMMIFEHNAGENWEDRLFEERLMVPKALRHILLPQKNGSLPVEWDLLSRHLVQPFAIVWHHEYQPELARSVALFGEKLLASSTVQEFFIKHAITDAELQEIFFSEAYEGKSFFNKMFDGTYPKKELSKDELTKIIQSEHDKTNFSEWQNSLYQAIELSENGRLSEAQVLLNELAQMYPWSAMVQSELAIALDRAGSVEQALQHVIDSIILDLQNPLGWQSLGVILNRLGSHNEAVFAMNISQYLQDSMKQA